MRKRFLLLVAVFFVLTFLISGLKANAYHMLWAEITYTYVSPGVYNVQLKEYRDCVGILNANTTNINITAPGCNVGRTVILNRTSVQIGNLYCRNLPVTCNNQSRFNFEESVFTGTITFSAAERACSNWILSYSDCCRQDLANLSSGGTKNLYVEAELKLNAGLVNSSPQFGPLLTNLVSYGQETRFSNYAIDPDGDSLVYSIQNPLEAHNTTVLYANPVSVVAYSPDSTKYAPINWSFSNSFPLISSNIDWSRPMPIYPVKQFEMNRQTGALRFTPVHYVPNPAINISSPQNKYAVVTQVEEYRKINGVPTKIGSVRRDIFLTVINPQGNLNPEITSVVANGVNITEADIIHLQPGSPLNFQFVASDVNLADSIKIATNVTQVLPGAVFTKGPGLQPVGRLSWTPTQSHIRDQIYYFHVRLEDNACPVKGYQTYTFGVKVVAAGAATGISEMKGQSTFTAFPNPFSEELTFSLNLPTKAESIQIYNLLGQQIDEIPLKTVGLGAQKVQWQHVGKYAAGTYLARLISADKTVQTLKFTKLK